MTENEYEDKRPDAKIHKLSELWQSYLWYIQLRKLRIASDNRALTADRGKSAMSGPFERWMKERLSLDENEAMVLKKMIEHGENVGPIWNWLVSIKGIGGSLAAQLLAQIDDISTFDNPSQLWRFAGFAVIDGKAEKNKIGEKSHFNRTLKAVCWNIGSQFIIQYTPIYREIYDNEKDRQRQLHPEKIKKNGKWMYTDLHLHNRAWRKAIKLFLQHLYVTWRTSEGLPVPMPWILREGSGHSSYIEPHKVEMEPVGM